VERNTCGLSLPKVRRSNEKGPLGYGQKDVKETIADTKTGVVRTAWRRDCGEVTNGLSFDLKAKPIQKPRRRSSAIWRVPLETGPGSTRCAHRDTGILATCGISLLV